MAADLGADEIVVQDLIDGRVDRQEPYALIADAFDLRGPANT